MSYSGNEILDDLIRKWFQWDRNGATREEVQQLVNDSNWRRMSKIMYPRLQFGCAGMRGEIGAGFAGMNELVVIQIAQGFADFLKQKFPEKKNQERGVVIGFDGRRNGKRFAELMASILLQRGPSVLLYSQMVPSSFVPFAVVEKNCIAGVMITASYSDCSYSGIKIFSETGVPLLPSMEKEVEICIARRQKPDEESWKTNILTSSLVSERFLDPYDEVFALYCQKLHNLLPDRFLEYNNCSELSFVYTAMNGIGYSYLKESLKEIHIKIFEVVENEKDPLPDFPTPDMFIIIDNYSGLEKAIAKANSEGLTLIFAHNADASRLVLAEKNRTTSTWKTFNASEVGALLGWWSLQIYKERHPNNDLSNCYMISSINTSRLLQSMSMVEGFHFEETISWFRWIVYRAQELAAQGKEVLLAFEESAGYMLFTDLLYKDAIRATCHLVSLASYLRAVGNLNLTEKLNELYETYGYHCSKNSFFYYNDHATLKSIFWRLRTFQDNKPHTYPTDIMNGRFRVRYVRDITMGIDTSQSNNLGLLPITPDQESITFVFENGVVFMLRESGTERKIKYHADIRAPPGKKDWQKYEHTLNTLVTAAIAEFLQPRENNLLHPSNY